MTATQSKWIPSSKWTFQQRDPTKSLKDAAKTHNHANTKGDRFGSQRFSSPSTPERMLKVISMPMIMRLLELIHVLQTKPGFSALERVSFQHLLPCHDLEHCTGRKRKGGGGGGGTGRESLTRQIHLDSKWSSLSSHVSE